MFLGTIQPELRSMVLEQTRSWKATDVYVGCSGNFTIERTLEGEGVQLYGNDVSIYTCALGWWLCGQKVPHTLKAESQEKLAWVEPYLDGGAGTIAVLLLGTRFLDAANKAGSNAYYDRMLSGYEKQFPRLFRDTLSKLSTVSLRLASYTAMDVREYLRDVVPAEAAVASFPPFWAEGYEKMWAPLEQHFDWPAPDYPILDDEGVRETLDLITGRRSWFFGSNHRWPEFEDNLRGLVQTGLRRVPMWVYASDVGSRIVRPRQNLEPVNQPRLGLGDEIGDRIALAPLTPGQFSALRSQYLDPSIAPALPLFAVAVLVDGRLIGAFGYTASEWKRNEAYLMSDFAVAPSDYRRLSKLVVMAALSTEAQKLCQRSMSRRVDAMSTTAFADNPVSMKYRGVLDLTKRTEVEGPHKFQLQYEGQFGRWTLAEALVEWKRRHAARSQAIPA